MSDGEASVFFFSQLFYDNWICFSIHIYKIEPKPFTTNLISHENFYVISEKYGVK